MPNSESRTPVGHILQVDRVEFVKRLGVIAQLDGVGRIPISLRYDGQDLILTYGCEVRIKAWGTWAGEARLSKAALKRFIKSYEEPHLMKAAGETQATVKRFVRDLGRAHAHLELVRQDDGTLLIDGHPIPCTWPTAE
jgi:hypothetical protein